MGLLDFLALDQTFNELNFRLGLATRELGLFDAVTSLASRVLQTESDSATRAAESLERISIKLLASPLSVHAQPMCQLMTQILQHTDSEYH